MPRISFRPSTTLLKTTEYTSIFLVAFSSLFIARKAFSAAPPAGGGTTTITVQTWDQIDNLEPYGETDPALHGSGDLTQLLKGLNSVGSTAAALYKGSAATAKNGDLIELGYFQLADGTANASATNLFAGTWRPLTTKTTIGHVFDTSGWSDTSKAGEFFFDVQFTRDATGTYPYSGTATINHDSDSGPGHPITDDTPSGLGGSGSGHLYNLDAATYNETGTTSARLGLRFYDVHQGATTGWAGPGSDNRGAATKYQTIMNPNWKWNTLGGAGDSVLMGMHLHNADGTVDNTNMEFEFDNTAARTANVSKVGTDDNRLLNDDFVTTISYYDGSSGMNVGDVGSSGIGSAIVSGFTGTGTIDGKNDGNILTVNSMTGNTGNDAYTFSGNIYQDATTSTDLTIIKEGGGEQILSGNVNAADSDSGSASAYLDIQEGTLILNPGNTLTQKFEYLTGESGAGLTLDNTGDGDEQTIELGFANTSTTQTFSGTVTLTGTGGTQNTIKVVSDTAKNTANYNKEQVLSGQVTGTEMLVKDGLGRLKLSNAANDFTNTAGTDVTINDGTLVAAHAAALGASTNTVVINKGKLELEGGIALANTTIAGHASSSSHKSMVGGDGTFSAITVGDGNNEIDVISPGRGISSSLSPSNQQVTLGTGASAANAMGDLTVTTLTLNDNAVFDWEIADFTGSAGTGFDVLKFGTLAFGAGAVVDVNVFSVASNGSAGGVSNLRVHSGTNGILFLKGDAHANITNWGGTTLAPGDWRDASSHFNVDDRGYNFHNGNLNGGWSVWYNGSGDFYMRYSAVPEPSTYVMVMGLLLVPGFRFFRRFRKKGIKQEDQ
jgi:hypothetical protein